MERQKIERIYAILRNHGFCGNCMSAVEYNSDVAKKEGYDDGASCAWKSFSHQDPDMGSFEARNGDPECTIDFCPFIKQIEEI